jgi:hypothetical protein
VSDFLVLALVLLLVLSGYTAGRVHGQIGYREGFRSGYRQGYADGIRSRPARIGTAVDGSDRGAATNDVQVIGSDDHERSERRQLRRVLRTPVHKVRHPNG